MAILETIGNLIKRVIDGIKTVINNVIRSFKEVLYGMTLQRKQSKKQYVVFEILDKNKNIDVARGKLSKNEQMGYVPEHGKIIHQPTVWNKNGQKTVICTRARSDTRGLDKDIEIMESMKGELEIKTKVLPITARNIIKKYVLDPKDIREILNGWEYDDIWATLDIKFKGGSIDPTQYDSEVSLSYEAQASQVVNSEMLAFLNRAGDMTIITTLIIGALLGFAVKSII